MPDLETVTLEGVEILSIGGPVHGVGSPPAGDYFTSADLRSMAVAAQELEAAGEWRVPTRVGGEPLGRNKLGHSPKQELLRNLEVTDGEMPSAGWITNQRVSEDGSKLLADIVDVPKKLGDLIKAKAYRTRSSELKSVTSQTTGKKHGMVVSGLAWLGGKMPAVRTLDDVVALYESEGLDDPDATGIFVYADAAAEIIWPAEAGFQDLMSDLQTALNPGGGDTKMWVQDISLDLKRAVVNDWGQNKTWVVPITVNDQSDPTPAPSSDWVEADDALVKAVRDLEERALTVRRRRADIRRNMDDKYTDEQRRTFAEATGLEQDKVTDEMLDKAAGVLAEEPKVDPAVQLEADERLRKFEEDLNTERKARELMQRELADSKRDTFVENVLRDGKALPGQRDDIVAMYEESPDGTRKFFESAPVNDQWAREYGSDDEQLDETQLEAEQKHYEDDAKSRLGVGSVI